jgi:BASS family bile acid:Na+ symporter
MKPENGLALIVLACAPGGMSALQFLSKKKEPAALAYGAGTTALLSFLAIFITPFLIGPAMPKGMTLTLPYGRAILFVVLFMLLPLVIGVLVHGTAKGEMGKTGLIAIIAFILISMLIGWLLGGPRKFTRPVLATASSMRNVALALAIAVRSFDLAVLTPLVAFFAIMVPLNLLYMLSTKVAGRIKRKKGEKYERNNGTGPVDTGTGHRKRQKGSPWHRDGPGSTDTR